ncbi:LOW QUALITY PROTEIN: titin-like [Dermatophagoides farinae]|uniref:LOW QUALITY PROTEIN: titin-like n=1 Tax=Dermatophagoides farinae TaxID=6954 RepID=UPI003F615F6E
MDTQQQQQQETPYLAPLFERPPEIENIHEGDDVLLKCKIRAQPPATVRWVRHGYMLTHTNKYLISNNPQTGYHSLIIKNFHEIDDGEYVCIASNVAGESSIIAVIKKGDKKDNKPEMATRQFDSFKELHDFQLNRLTRQIDMKSNFDCEKFENDLIKNDEFRHNKCSLFERDEHFNRLNQQSDQRRTDMVESAPEIIEKPKDIVCYENDDLVFDIRVGGNPIPKIYWFKNGQPMPQIENKCRISYDNDIVRLHISRLLNEDAGSYTILAENNHGSATFSINLNVHYFIEDDIYTKPQSKPTNATGTNLMSGGINTQQQQTMTTKTTTTTITQQRQTTTSRSADTVDELPIISGIRPNFYLIPYDMEAMENQIVRFELRVSGRPEPEITWFKDGRQLFDCEHFKLVVNEEGSHALLIMGADPQDSGLYKCVASNQNGQSAFTVRLLVLEKEPTVSPKFVERFQNTTIKAGESIVFHCRAVGTPSPILTWQKDGIQIDPNPPAVEIRSDQCSSSLYLNNVSARDSGWYQCTAQNQGGTVATRARLNIESDQKTLLQGEPLRLNLPKTHRRIEPEPGQQSETIILRHVQRYYEEIPPEQRDFITYEERKTKPIFATHLRDVNLQKGMTGHFEAYLKAADYSNMKIEWFLNDKLLENSERFIITDKYGYIALTILNVQPEDSGIITCKVTNQYGDAQTSATLKCADTIAAPAPAPVPATTTTTAKPEKPIQQQVKPEQEKQKETTISQQKQQAKQQEEKDEEYRQKYQQIEDSEFYSYQKEVEESYGKIAPHFVRPLQSQILTTQGATILLEAQITPVNDPNMRIEWYLNGQPLISNERISSKFNFGYISLVIVDLRESDSGVYMVRAINGANEATSTASIHVNPLEPPPPPPAPKPIIEKKHQQVETETQQQQQQTTTTATSKIRKHTREEHVYSPTAASIVDIRQIRPYFKKHFQNLIDTTKGDTIRFEALVEPNDDPNLEVYIVKDEQIILPTPKIQILYNRGLVSICINDLATEDCGVYKCTVKNSLGQAETIGELRVKEPVKMDDQYLKFQQQQQMDTMTTKETVLATQEFYTHTQPPPPPQPPVIAMKQESSPPVMQFQPSPQVQTKQPPIKSVAVPKMTTGMAPIFRIPLQIPPLMYSEGENVYMEAFIEPVNDPNLKIEWYLDKVPVVFTQRHHQKFDFGCISMMIETVNINDGGEYTCCVRNHYGQAVSSANVSIVRIPGVEQTQPPEIPPPPRPALPIHIAPAIPPPPVYSYFDESQRMQTKQEWFDTTKTTVTTDQYEQIVPQRAYYQEVYPVTTGPPPPILTTTEPREIFPKPKFVTKMNNVTIPEGKTACLESRIEPTLDPNLAIDWFFNGKPLTVGNRFQPYYHFDYVVLKILKTQPNDSGLYTCRVSNESGFDEMSTTIVCYEENLETDIQFHEPITKTKHRDDEEISGQQQQAPRIKSTSMKDIHTIEGQKIHLECYVQPMDDPDLVVEWYKDNELLRKGSRFVEICDFGYVCLDILCVYPEDSGLYTLKATNKYGTVTKSCNIYCMPTANLDTRSLNEISMQSIRRLELRHEQRFERETLITEPPKFLQPLQSAKRIENERVHFETRLVPIGDENLHVEWFLNGQSLKSSSRISFINDFGYVSLDIKELTPYDSGTYTCRARNANGEDSVSATLTVQATDTIINDTIHPGTVAKFSTLETKTFKRKEIEDDITGQTRPTFKHSLKGTRQLEEGMAAHFQCVVEPSRDETMNVEWFHNGRPMPVGNRYHTLFDFGFITLDILKVTAEDSGEYRIRVTNHLGMVEDSIHLTVIERDTILRGSQQPQSLEKIQILERTSSAHKKKKIEDDYVIIDQPKFGQKLPELSELMEGQPLYVESTLTPINDPTMKVDWYLNDQLLKCGHRFRTLNDFGYVSLQILYAYPEDSGRYECRATNDLGEDRIHCNVQVKSRKIIDTSTIHDESLARIQQIERHTRVKQEQEIFDQPIRPRIIRPLRNSHELNEGDSVCLELTAEPVNDSTMIIEWSHDGVPIKTGHRFVVIHEFGYIALRILYVYPEDSGTYTVRISNASGEVIQTSNIIVKEKRNIIFDTIHPEGLEKIQMLEKHVQRTTRIDYEQMDMTAAPHFVSKLRANNTQLTEGDNCHIECQIEPINDPDMVVEILHDGRPLKTGSRFRTLCEFGYIALDIHSMNPEDMGTYKFRISNRLGQIEDNINLQVRPIKSIQTDTMYGETLKKLNILEQQQAHRVTDVDDGKTQQKPIFTQPLHNVYNVREGSNAHLECRLIPVGDPSMNVEWYKNGRPLQHSSRYHHINDFGYISLDIHKVESKDSGTYTVRATNELGEAHTLCTLEIPSEKSVITDTTNVESLKTIQYLERNLRATRSDHDQQQRMEKPNFFVPIRGPNMVNENDRVCLECQVTPIGDSTMTYQWYKNGQELSPSSRIATSNDFGYVFLEIASACEDDSGVYMLKIANESGEAISSHQLRVNTFPAIDTQCQHPETYKQIQYLEKFKRGSHRQPIQQQPSMGEPPKFTKHLNSIDNGNEGDYIRLETRVEPEMDEKLTIEWYKNGQILTLGSRITSNFDFGLVILEIIGAKSEDTGVYTCRAVNQFGEATNSCTIKIKDSNRIETGSFFPETLKTIEQLEQHPSKIHKSTGQLEIRPQQQGGQPPYFTNHIQNMVIPEGQNVTFECNVQQPIQDPNLEFRILHNGREIQVGNRILVQHEFGYVRIEIDSVKPQDSGIYTVKVANNFGESTSTASLNVIPTTNVDYQPVHPAGMKGMKAIEKIEKQQQKYTSTITTTTATQPEKEFPSSPKFIRSLPNEIRIREGNDLELNCEISDDTTSKIEWFLNGVPLNGSSPRINLKQESGKILLTIKKSEPKDSGLYKCRASNNQGESYTTTQVYVQPSESNIVRESLFYEQTTTTTIDDEIHDKLPSIIPLTDTEIFLNEGSSLHLEVKVDPMNDSSMQIEWYHNETELKIGNRITTFHGFGFAILEINDCNRDDGGTYACIARNDKGYSQQNFQVNLIETMINEPMIQQPHPQPQQEKPQFQQPLNEDIQVVEGESIHVATTVIPHDIQLEWFHNGQPLQQSSRIKTTGDFGYVVLEISKVEPKDSGEYLLVATNKYGIDTLKFNLDCQPTSNIDHGAMLDPKYQSTLQMMPRPQQVAPKFNRKLPEQINVWEGQSVHLESDYQPFDGTVQIDFLRDGKPLVASERFQTINEFSFAILDIVYLYEEDSGIYEIRATNQFGTDRVQTRVNVQSRDQQQQILLPGETVPTINYIDRVVSSRTTHIQREVETRYESPKFELPLNDQTNLKEGDCVHLETRVTPSSDPSLSIEWYKDNQPLRASNRIRTISEFGFVILEISPVCPEDSGLYTVRATNNVGEAVLSTRIFCHDSRNIVYDSQILQHTTTMDKAQIFSSTKQQKPRFLDQLTDLNMKEHDFIHLESRLTPIGDPTMNVEWFVNGKPFTTGSRFRTISDFGYVVLEIIEAYARDSGVYECVATNQYGRDSIKSQINVEKTKNVIMETQLPVEHSRTLQSLEQRIMNQQFIRKSDADDQREFPMPKFFGKIESTIHRKEGDALHVDCRVEPSNDPDLTIEWFLDGKPLITSSRIHSINDFGFVVLDIDWLFDRDCGTYQCVASNHHGSDTFAFNLVVKPESNIVYDSQLQPTISTSTTITSPQQQQQKQLMAPHFTKSLVEKIIINEGENIHFDSRIEPFGDGEMKIEWLHNQEPLRSGHRHKTINDFGYISLDIISADLEDSGHYTCVAKSPRGEDQIMCLVEVRPRKKLDFKPQIPKEMSAAFERIQDLDQQQQQIPRTPDFVSPDDRRENMAPTFVQNPEPLCVLEGDVARFCCRIIGYPKPRVIWTLNGKPIPNGSRYKIRYDGIHHLEIPKTRQYDQGKIEVIAKNNLGEVSASTMLEVRPRNADYRAILKHSPKTNYDDNMEKYQKSRKELETENVFEERISDKKEEIVWYTEQSEDGERIKIREHLVDYVPIKADATYCKDETTTAMKPAMEMEPKKKFKIISSPKPKSTISITPDQQQQAETLVHGREVVTKEQKQTQKEIRDQTEITRKIKETSSIDQEHKMMTAERKIATKKPPQAIIIGPRFIKKIKPCRCVERNQARFECEFSGKPTPEVTWYRENFEIQCSDDFKIINEEFKSTLIIQEVFLEDSGVFSVAVRNDGGIAKCSANLIVEEMRKKSDDVPPSFTKTIQCIRTKSGLVITLDAKINGSQPMNVFWAKNGQRIQEDKKHRIVEHEDQYTLVVLDAHVDDSGSYECVAMNNVGEARCIAEVFVEEAEPLSVESFPEEEPKIIEKLKDITVKEGQSAVFKCRITCTNQEVIWYKDDEMIKQSRYFRMTSDRECHTLRIYEAFTEDEGIYRCCIGRVSTSARLRVISDEAEKPKLSELNDQTIKEDSQLHSTCTLSGSPTPKVTWYKDGQQIYQSREVQV